MALGIFTEIIPLVTRPVVSFSDEEDDSEDKDKDKDIDDDFGDDDDEEKVDDGFTIEGDEVVDEEK